MSSPTPATLRILHIQQQLSLIAPSAEAQTLSAALSTIDAQRRALHADLTLQRRALDLHAPRLPLTRCAQTLAGQQALFSGLINYIDDILAQDAALADQAHTLEVPLYAALSSLARTLSRIRTIEASQRLADKRKMTVAERHFLAHIHDLFTHTLPTP